MSDKPKKSVQEREPDEDAEKRDVILRRMLNTPPKPKKGKGGKPARSEK